MRRRSRPVGRAAAVGVGLLVSAGGAAVAPPPPAGATTGGGDSSASAPITGQVVGYTTGAGVFEVSADGARSRQVPGTDAGSGSPAWSHDGNVVAFTEGARAGTTTGDVGLDTVVADGSCRVSFPQPAQARYATPSWSRDGSHVAFVLTGTGTGPSGLEVARSDGTHAVVLPSGNPGQWAPDGSERLVYAAGGIQIADVATGSTRVVDATTDAEFPVWSPDARHVAYSISTQPAVWVVGTDGTGRHHVTPVDPQDEEDFFPAWSPDGSRIAFNRSGPDGSDVWVVNADGTGAHPITTSHAVGASGPLWSPDGTMLAYDQNAGPGPDPAEDVWVVKADGSDPHLVASDAQLAGFFSRSLPIGAAGYRVLSVGAVSGFGTECSLGFPVLSGVVVPPAVQRQAVPLAAMATTPDGGGYWLAGPDGTVFNFGDAASHSPPGRPPVEGGVVGMAATPDGGGYWLVTSRGGVLSFGDAAFHGSLAERRLNGPIVGMATTPDGRGYWLVGADGGVFSFGDAQFEGSAYTPTAVTGALAGRLATPIVGMTATADGHGYWLAAAGGGVFTYGRAPYLGSMGGRRLDGPVVGITATRDRGGYWLAGADGGVFTFGDAVFRGTAPPGSPAVALGS